MARATNSYSCQECGATHSKWSGRCDDCGAWNTITEEARREATPKGLSAGRGRNIEFVGLKGKSEVPARKKTNIDEFDRVCGGGLVAGSALLVGGDPGIGKS
ncbi:MAG: DNA repair protein RadA, partial [Rhodospirillaceae bacterium]|nr:DNA repair protein RadA [Rhodospirillaceae bacterium]